MKKLMLAVFFMSGALVAKEPMRPMNEMHGGCSNFKMDLRRELKLLEKQAAKPVDGKVEFEQPISLALKDQTSVAFTAVPEKKFTGENYASVVPFAVKKTGKYRLIAKQKIWMDVVEAKSRKLVDADTFEMQTDCSLALKAVEYTLTAGVDYVLQVSGSKNKSVDLLLSSRE